MKFYTNDSGCYGFRVGREVNYMRFFGQWTAEEICKN